MGRSDLGQLENGTVLEDAAFLDLEIQEHTGDAAAGLVVFQQPEIALYQRLVEAARNRLAELEYGIEKSKVDSIISPPDLWIAAITRAAGGILVTHNSDIKVACWFLNTDATPTTQRPEVHPPALDDC
jgi:hypothetical protein